MRQKRHLSINFPAKKTRPGGTLGLPWLEGGNDLAEIVADETEANVLCELLHDATQSVLRIIRHRVRLVQDDQLIRRHTILCKLQRLYRYGEKDQKTFGRVCRIQLNFPDSIIFPSNHFKGWLKQRNEDVSETGTSNISSKKCCLVEIKYLPLPTPLYFCVNRILPSKQGTGKGCIRIKIAMKSGIRPFQNASDLKHCHKRIPMLNFF